MPGAWLLLVVVALVVLLALSGRRRKQEQELRANLDWLKGEHARLARSVSHRLEFLEQRLSEIASASGQTEEAIQPDVTTKRGEVAEDRTVEQLPESEEPVQAAVRSLDKREDTKPVLEAPVATTVPSPATESVPEEVTPHVPGPAEWTTKPPTKARPAPKAQLPKAPGPVAGRKVARTYLSRAADWVQKSTAQDGEKPVDWEALIGGSWLNIIGIVVLVVGMVLFSQHSLTQFGPAGKIGTGIGVSLFLLACGVLLERVKRYRLLAWTFIGGGWALLYFTAYAAYNIAASRVIESPVVGLFVLCATAAGMIVHSLIYRSPLLTALAYGLGFFAVTISPLNNYTLLTSGLLAASQLVVLRYVPWHHLPLVAIAGTYLNHWRWLWPILGDPTISLLAGELRTHVPVLIESSDFWLSQAVLAFYWVLFVATTLLRAPGRRHERIAQLTVSIANTLGMLTLSGWQIWVLHGEKLYYLTASATLAYVAAATTAKLTQRADLYRFNSSVALLLYTVTLPLAESDFGFAKDWHALYWVIGSVCTIIVGFLVRDVTLRASAYLLSGLSCLALFAINLQGSFATPLEINASEIGWTEARWWIPPTVLILFFAISEWLQRTAGKAGILPFAKQLAPIFSYAASIILAVYLWKITQPAYVALSWLGAGLVMFEFGVRDERLHARFQAYSFLALAVVAALAINFGQHPSVDPTASANLPALWRITLPAVAVLSYVYWRASIENTLVPARPDEVYIGAFASALATFLLALLLWFEVNTALVSLAWIAVGQVMFELGKRLRQVILRANGYALFGAAFIGLLGVNLYKLYVPQETAMIGDWLVVSIAAAAFYQLTWRLLRDQRNLSLEREERWCATVPSIGGTAILAILAWKELDPIYVAPVWTLMVLALTEIGLLARQNNMQAQGHVLALLAFGRLFVANFVAPGEVALPIFGAEWELSQRLLTVLPVIGAFYYLRFQSLEAAALALRPTIAQLYSWGAAIALLALVRFEFGHALAVMGMAIIALGLLIVGRLFNDAHFRMQSYLLGVLVFARSWSTNAYLIGSFYGLPERVATVAPSIVVLAVMSLLSAGVIHAEDRDSSGRFSSIIQSWDRFASDVFAVLAAALMAILIYYEIPADMITVAWGIEAFVLIALGLIIEKRSLRFSGLLLVLVSLLKLTLIDMIDAEPVYRIISFLVLGAILLTASLIYTRYRNIIEKYV